MYFGNSDDDDAVLVTINTTPLVDVMLVLLIIFLITIPVVIHAVPVHLPKESARPFQTQPQTVTITADRDGHLFWNDAPLTDVSALQNRLTAAATQDPRPEIHIRGDRDGRFRPVGEIIAACRRAGITKIGFITEPPATEMR